MQEILQKIGLEQVESDNSDIYKLQFMAEGGQGAVFQTQHKNLLVKLSCAKTGTIDIPKIYRRYASLRCRTDLPSYLAKPLCEIKPIEKNGVVVYGYVMELMEDMVSLGSLFRQKNENPINYIKRLGGIRRMYIILRKVAEILDGIHCAGYCYGDLNPNNVFVSSDPTFNAVQLIDCDNLMIAADFKGTIYYPGYGAPELMKKSIAANTPITDTWSFAILAFYTLRQVHPFKGLLVENAVTDEISLMEQKASEGDLPFIDDATENNQTERALPINIMETTKLQNLFAKTFGKNKSDLSRPVLSEWIESLKEGEHDFLKCGNCGELYIWQKEKQCPFCDSKSVTPYVLALGAIQHEINNNLHPCTPRIRIIDEYPVEIQIPLSQYKIVPIEMFLDSKNQKILFKHKNSNEIQLEWRKDSRSAKTVVVPPEISAPIKVVDNEKNFLIFPVYNFDIPDENDNEKKGRSRSIITFQYRSNNA